MKAQQAAMGGYDLHCHYFPGNMPNWAKRFASKDPYFWIRHSAEGCAHCAMMMRGDEEFRSLSDDRLWAPEKYIENQLERGIQMMALSPTPQNFYYDGKPEETLEIARFQNDSIAQLQQSHPDHFIGLGTVPLQDPELACQELERCVKELGFAGVEIATTCGGSDLDEEKFFVFFETAERLDACIFVHPWYFPNAQRLGKAWGNWMLTMPFETATAMYKLAIAQINIKLPKLRIGFAHGGGSFAWLHDRMVHGANVRPEYYPDSIDFESFIKSIYIDSHVCSTRNLKHLIEIVGSNRVMAGSDWPYPLGMEDLSSFISALEDPRLIKQILIDTPREFLGLQ